MSLIRRIEREVRRDVLLADLFMTLYCLYLIITDSATLWIGFVFGFTPMGCAMLVNASRLFKLCLTHKLMILHINMVSACVIYQAEVGFGDWLPFMRSLMFSIGLLLWIRLIYQNIKIYPQWRRRILGGS